MEMTIMNDQEYIEQLEQENLELVTSLNDTQQELKESKDTIKALTKQVNNDGYDDAHGSIQDDIDDTYDNSNKDVTTMR